MTLRYSNLVQTITISNKQHPEIGMKEFFASFTEKSQFTQFGVILFIKWEYQFLLCYTVHGQNRPGWIC